MIHELQTVIEDRNWIQLQGFDVLRVNFYASTHSIAEIRNSSEYKEPTPYSIRACFDPNWMRTGRADG